MRLSFHFIIGLILAGLAVLGFASTFLFGAELTKECAVSPLVLSFLRFAIASFILLSSCLCSRQERKRLCSPNLHCWLNLTWIGIVGTSLMAWFVFMGCARVSTANASMADALTPMMIFVVSSLMTKHFSLHGLVGLSCGFIGALLVIQVITTNGVMLEAYSMGDIFIALSAAAWGIYSVMGHDLIVQLGSRAFSSLTMLIGAIAIGSLLPFINVNWPTTFRAWVLVGGLGLFSTLMPFWAWNAAQKYLPISFLAVTAYFTPVIAVGLAMIFRHESATTLQWLGTIFIVASAIMECDKQRK